MKIEEWLAAAHRSRREGAGSEKRSPPSGRQLAVVLRGNTPQHTLSPAGDISHGFPAPRPSVGEPDHLVFLLEGKSVRSH